MQLHQYHRRPEWIISASDSKRLRLSTWVRSFKNFHSDNDRDSKNPNSKILSTKCGFSTPKSSSDPKTFFSSVLILRSHLRSRHLKRLFSSRFPVDKIVYNFIFFHIKKISAFYEIWTFISVSRITASKVAVERMAIFFRIREFLGSDLGPEAGASNWCFSWFLFKSPQTNYGVVAYLKLDQRRFFP